MIFRRATVSVLAALQTEKGLADMKRAVILASLLCSIGAWGAAIRAAETAQFDSQGSAALPQPLTLKSAVEYARAHYPAIRAALAGTASAQSGIDLARTAYLPRTDLLLQVNRATRNNVFGLILPNGTIPAISGPVLDQSSITSTFGSAAGLRFSWEPFDFGLRRANVGVAESIRRREQAASTLTVLEVSVATADAFLALAAAEQAILAAQASVDRMDVFTSSISVLVKNQLRPGADESRARAELAQAQIALIRAEQERDLAMADLAEWLGHAGEKLEVSSEALLSPAPREIPPATDLSDHPKAEAEDAELAIVSSRRRALEKEYRPRFFLESAVFGRGTGARVDGAFKGGGHGLAPSEGNWAVGMNVMFPLFDFKENRVRQAMERHNESAEAARYDAVIQHLRGDVERARVQVENARRIAERTPVALQASRELETQARERYRAGLGAVVEVADALRLLRQSEIDDALAKLSVWRARIALSAANGNIDELLSQVSP